MELDDNLVDYQSISDNSTTNNSSHEDSSDRSSNIEDPKLELLTKRSYLSKKDIISTIAEYNNMVNWDYKITQNDARRYYVRCAKNTCSFRVNFNFRRNQFGPPSLAIADDCDIILANSSLARVVRPHYLANLTTVA